MTALTRLLDTTHDIEENSEALAEIVAIADRFGMDKLAHEIDIIRGCLDVCVDCLKKDIFSLSSEV